MRYVCYLLAPSVQDIKRRSGAFCSPPGCLQLLGRMVTQVAEWIPVISNRYLNENGKEWPPHYLRMIQVYIQAWRGHGKK